MSPVSVFSAKYYKKLSQLLVIMVSLFTLSACGFHLKHQNGLVEKFPQIYLQTDNPKGELARQVRLRLRGANIKILNSPHPDVATLHLKNESRSERTISLYSNAQNAEKEVGYTLAYSIKLPNYTAKEFNVNLYRDFLDNPSQALAKSREAELLTKELRGIAADHIINTMLSMKSANEQ